MIDSQEVRRSVVLPIPPEEAWEALTDPRELEAWLADEVELEATPGGAASFRWGDGEERLGVVEAADPSVRLAFRWRDADDAADESEVEFRLDAVPEGTLVTVRERRLVAVRALPLRLARRAWNGRLQALAAHASALARC